MNALAKPARSQNLSHKSSLTSFRQGSLSRSNRSRKDDMHAGTVHQPPRAVLDPTASNLIATENALDLTGKFTAWQRFVNSKIIPVALPLLIKISPAIQPIYSWYDGAFAQSSANLPTNSYKPIVVFSCRTLSDMQKYRNDFDTLLILS